MNENQTPLAGELLKTATPFRVHVANFLAFVGLVIAAAAQTDFEPLLALLPEASRETLTGVGLSVVALKPFLNLLFDLVDDGKLNKSQVLIPLVLFCCLLSSCGLSVSPDGCLTGTYTKNGQTYKVGPCFGEDGKPNRWRAQWANAEGVSIRSTYHTKNKRVIVEYLTDGGGWVGWDSKSGVLLDGNPLVVQIVAEQESSATNGLQPENVSSSSRPSGAGVPAGGL